LLLTAAEGQQDIAGGQHHLEGDEEVEQVAGQERGRDAGGEHQVGRLEAHVVPLGARLADGVDEDRKERHLGDDEEDRGEPVGDQCDAHRAGPSSCFCYQRAVAVDLEEQGNRYRHEGGQDRDADGPLGNPGAADEDRQCRPGKREHDRQGHQPGHGDPSRAMTFS
jgi:hypothetical protein